MIRVKCPVCSAVRDVPDSERGRPIACKSCGEKIATPPAIAKPALSPIIAPRPKPPAKPKFKTDYTILLVLTLVPAAFFVVIGAGLAFRGKTAERSEVAAESASPPPKKQPADEWEDMGLVLKLGTLRFTGSGVGHSINGVIENRTGRNLSYASVTFNLYDDSGAQVGTAWASIGGLDAGGRWKFEAHTFGKDYATYRPATMIAR